MNIELINEIIQGSLQNTMTFPQVVGKLLAEGMESYHVDLVRAENSYYLPDGKSYKTEVPFAHGKAAEKFSSEQVASAVKSIQAGLINYKQFLEQIMNAGTVYYIVYLLGKKVIYFGREGDFHIENFPAKK